MKKYEKPEIIEEDIQLEDIIAVSCDDGTTDGKVVSLEDLFSK